MHQYGSMRMGQEYAFQFGNISFVKTGKPAAWLSGHEAAVNQKFCCFSHHMEAVAAMLAAAAGNVQSHRLILPAC